jgi:hypothetical protein
LVQKLIALKCKQKVLIFRKICTPKFLGCYKYPKELSPYSVINKRLGT